MSDNYSSELKTAVAAATRAGAILREAFNQDCGPTGTLHHAEADEHAETAIRDTLLEAFPDDGFLGEELLPVPGSATDRLWVVDPNDGTSAFMSGYRGSAVSIALMDGGDLVLGVVYAFNYPDDRGDLICWAEGQPVTRNGEAVTRDWPDAPTVRQTVLLSFHADLNPTANADCCSPMRYRAIPSIAYRLALVAVGEGDVAVSIQNGLASWDVAAGHAILKGAGADVYDRHGMPHSYVNGRLKSGEFAFGGPRSLVHHLTGQEWHVVFARPKRNLAYPLCQPRHGGAVDPEVLARAQGCLLGQLAGDSLGSLVEFQSPEMIRQRYPDGPRRLADGGTFNTIAGQPTDDSEMALVLARSILQKGGYDAKAALAAYQYWYDSGPFDCGMTIAAGLRGVPNVESQANGAMMRVCPVGIFGATHPLATVEKWAMADAKLTHPNPVCLQANALFATAIAYAISSGDGPEAVYDGVVERAETMGVDANLMRVIRAAATEPPEDYLTAMGWVLIAFQNALFQLLHALSLEEAVVDSVARGGDTDTNAAICGALLGAVYGRQAIPAQWTAGLLRCRPIAGLPGVTKPRPESLWPVDAMELAEALVLAP